MIFEETFEKNNKQISYIRYGEWTETVILFFHGFTGSKRYIPEKYWEKILEEIWDIR